MATTLAPAARNQAAPSPFAMLLLGVTTCLFGLYQTGLAPVGTALLGAGLFYGGIGLVFSGILDWRQHNAFGAVVSIAYGLFWLSLMGLILLPATGFGQPPGPAAVGSYLGMWGLFTAVLFAAGPQGGRRLQMVLGLLLASLLLHAVSELCAAPLAAAAAGWCGLAAGLGATHGGLRRLRRDGDQHVPAPPHSADTP